MQIVNYFRARVCNSSIAAFQLAQNNNNYITFSKGIISVKNVIAHCKLLEARENLNHEEESLLNSKQDKYKFLLTHLSSIENDLISSAISNNFLKNRGMPDPRLNQLSPDNNEYSLPYNNRPDKIVFSGIKGNLI